MCVHLQVDDQEALTLIDFPQMVSTSHANAEELFDRDVSGVVKFFERKFGSASAAEVAINSYYPSFQAAITGDSSTLTIDKQLRASGFKSEHQKVLDSFQKEDEDDDSASSHSSDAEEGSEDEASSDDDGSVTEEHAAADDAHISSSSSSASSSDHQAEGLAEEIEEMTLRDEQPSTSRRTVREQKVAQRFADQRRKEIRRQTVARASRNSMKSKNKGKRKGEATGNKLSTITGSFF